VTDVTIARPEWALGPRRNEPGGDITKLGETMKLRAITLAAAGLLAAASAQAELQTWRYSGLIMTYWDESGHPGEVPVPPAQMQFDLTFDTAAVGNGGMYTTALTTVVINGDTTSSYTLIDPSILAGNAYTDLATGLESFNTGYMEMYMRAPAPLDATTQAPRPIASVSEFLTNTDQQIDQIYLDFVQDGTYTWQDLAGSPLTWSFFPQITLRHPYADGQTYALIGAHNITPGVPEPSAWALTLLGSLGAAALARRRQKATAQVS